jgi:hypothetical protein
VASARGWAGSHPHAAAALLRWGNRYRHNPTRALLILLLAFLGAAALAAVPQTGVILGWLGSHLIVTFVVAVCLFALSALRRRERMALAAAHGWLAATPAGSPAYLEMTAGTAVRLALLIAFAVLACLLGELDPHALGRLALALLGAALVGSLAGWRLPRAADEATPGFHYAIVPRARAQGATAPVLWPLGYWPAAQARIFRRPKVLARVAFMALLTLPLGTPGQVALVIVAAAVAASSLAALSLAAVRVAFAAARWLAPTTLAAGRFAVALLWRVILTQALAAAVLVFLGCAIDLPKALRLGIPLAAGLLVASLTAAAVACGWACRRAGLGAP